MPARLRHPARRPASQDGASRSNAVTHPRAFGAFPRVLARYVRELDALTLEAAIQRMTAVAANEIMAYDRGRLATGMAADIVIFDPNTIRDRATFSQPDAISGGMKFVIVNGGRRDNELARGGLTHARYVFRAKPKFVVE